MSTSRSTRPRRARRFALALLVGTGLTLSSQAIHVQASAATVEWVDGGDDSPCLNDDTGKAITELPGEFWCTMIVGCYQGDDGKWVLPSRKTGIWQGNPADVRYADEPAPAPTPKPTTPKPTTPQPTTPKPGKSPSTGGSPGTPATGPVGTPAGTPAAPVPVGAPTAPAAPTVAVKGSDITVTWQPSANAALETVTGYTLQFTDAAPVQLDAATVTHTFTDLDDGNYRAAVQAVNAAGPSAASPPSEVATVGTPIAEVVGDLVVDGTLEPGGSVTVTGTKFAADVPELTLELHSDPVVLGTVATDSTGGFETTVTIPSTVEAGDHALVVLHEGQEITSSPVQIAAAAAAAAVQQEATAAVESVPPYLGLAILAALGAAGTGALLWHLATGRRRRDGTRSTRAQQVPTNAVGVS